MIFWARARSLAFLASPKSLASLKEQYDKHNEEQLKNSKSSFSPFLRNLPREVADVLVAPLPDLPGLRAQELVGQAVPALSAGHGQDGDDVGAEGGRRWVTYLGLDVLDGLVVLPEELQRLGHARHGRRGGLDLA